MRSALRRVRPALIMLVELELWPNLLRLAHGRGIPVVLVNGRLSERSYRGYRWLKPLLSHCLKTLEVVCAQNDEYRERFVALGADPLRTVTTGSIKFDGVRCDRNDPAVVTLLRQLPLSGGGSLWIAGSTHAPEEEIVLGIYERLLRKHSGLRLMLVPRHAERFDEVSRLVRQRGFFVWERASGKTLEPESAAGATSAQPVVLLLNTLGELSAAWGCADVAFVGGSLTPRGGQNMIEPAAYGVPTIVGPNTANFRQIVEALIAAEALTVVKDEAELESLLDAFLSSPESAQEQGARGRSFVLTQQGATERTLSHIEPWLPATVRP
jgi:3-deoxy-D-manno-octulosonic-acid transferase